MEPHPPAPEPTVPAARKKDPAQRLPAEARAALQRFQAGGDPTALDPVIFAILEDYMPRRSAVSLSQLSGDKRLIDDLGFDSLAITEVVFATEELFGISITNEEILQVRTLDDLRGFIRRKVAVRSPR